MADLLDEDGLPLPPSRGNPEHRAQILGMSRPQLSVISRLSGPVSERLGWYVYALIDPRDDTVFYVGKGKAERALHHGWQARIGSSDAPMRSTLKLDQIRAIHSAGLDVRIWVLRHDLATEKLAEEVEAAVIDAFRLARREMGDLTNEVAGKGSVSRGAQPIEELVYRYAPHRVEIAPSHRVLLVRPKNLWSAGLGEADRYRAARQWWKVSPGRRSPDIAMVVVGGIVRSVYRLDPKRWKESPEGGRWRFTGKRDPDLEAQYVGGDVSHLLPAGTRTPVRYVNC